MKRTACILECLDLPYYLLTPKLLMNFLIFPLNYPSKGTSPLSPGRFSTFARYNTYLSSSSSPYFLYLLKNLHTSSLISLAKHYSSLESALPLRSTSCSSFRTFRNWAYFCFDLCKSALLRVDLWICVPLGGVVREFYCLVGVFTIENNI